MKRKLKKKVKIFIVIIFILNVVLGALLLFKPSKNSVKKENKVDINIVDKVYKRINDDEINIEFLTWINKNYKDSLNKINKLLKKDSYDRKMWHEATGNSFIVLKDLYENKYENMDNVKIISSKDQSTISFVGDVSLADNWFIAPVYDERGGISGILGDKMLKIMTSSDVMIANSEFTVSSRGAKIPNKMYTFRAKKERLSIYDEMGVDMVTLANNHVYDYGADAFLDMLDAFNEYKIPHIGAGHNSEEAKKPFYFIINGYKFAFVSATRAEKFILTPGATDTEPGVFRCYDPTDMINLIKELRPNNDYVIPIIHFGRENSHSLEDEQVSSAKAYIDAGADMVVGHHAHTLQGIEIYNDKPIIYNLGNFLFNNETIDTALFQVLLNNDGTMEYYMIPALQSNSKTEVLEGDDKIRVINDINSYSVNVRLDEKLCLKIKEITKIDLSAYIDSNNFVVGQIDECEKIEGTHLHKCLVNIGKEKLQIMCGASNARSSLKVVVALDSAMLPNGTCIRSGQILGNKSLGMLCSKRELNLTDKKFNDEGIIELPDSYKIGEKFNEIFTSNI